MNRILLALSSLSMIAIALGFAQIAVMRIEGVLVAALAASVLFCNVTIVSLIRRSFTWRAVLRWTALSVAAGVGGFLAGPPAMRFYLRRDLGTFDRIADRCATETSEHCLLSPTERKYTESATRNRFLPYTTTAMSPVDWYVFVVRPEDSAAQGHLARHPCVRHLAGHWYIEYRC